MHVTDAAAPTAPPQQDPHPRPACVADDDGLALADASASRCTACGGGSAMGVADLAANTELSGTMTAVASTADSAKPLPSVEFAEFRPFPAPAALPQLSPCVEIDAWGTDDDDDDDDDDDGDGDGDGDGDAGGGRGHPTTQRRRRRRYHSNTDSFTVSYSSSNDGSAKKTAPLKPSAEAIATAFTPIWKGGKIERTKELMERVALAKAQFRARQLAAAGPIRRE